MELQCTTHRVGDHVVVAVSGLADLSTAPHLHSHLRHAVGEHPGGTVLVDLDSVTALDDAALGLLLGAAARAREAGGDIQVVCTHARLRQRLAATRFDQVVKLRSSVASATSIDDATAPAEADRSGEPYTAVIFTNQRTDSDHAAYEAAAALMERLAADQPGYRGIESVRNADGLGVTVSYWATEGDARMWKRHAEHLLVQRSGRDQWYSSYRVRVATVEREYSYDQGHGSSHQLSDPD